MGRGRTCTHEIHVRLWDGSLAMTMGRSVGRHGTGDGSQHYRDVRLRIRESSVRRRCEDRGSVAKLFQVLHLKAALSGVVSHLTNSQLFPRSGRKIGLDILQCLSAQIFTNDVASRTFMSETEGCWLPHKFESHEKTESRFWRPKSISRPRHESVP